ncbi:MAG: hypothetical protein PWR03_1585 [Tenuifilum sp.]|jgi:protein-S-isoprenylcysteine O-methyltransferase Ste14|uniref:methyltransferase family protein n=1 Tax=Tenuifilum sp. TaxID=2760880 RepID=UPI0024AB3BC8|nr:isoprenylcysteine carboxylmethyltransferase family protein [Tenuifilum sp.]MDI3527402.1 hypothetical protein [Tenuifilum sp.]
MIKYLILLSAIFFVSEFVLMVFKRSPKEHTLKKSDRGSMALLWITISLGFTFGFIFANYNIWKLANYVVAGVGLLLIIVGAIIRWLSIFQLKQYFTVNVAVASNHQLKTDGLYGYVRHPSYLGLLLIMIGFALAMNTISSFLIISVSMLLAVLYRIRVEEQALKSEFKEEYESYSKKVKMLIPWIW